ncbi:MAG: cell division protein ZapE [Chloroherpetonaceae bacterium]|nr:cell division protein ZapE [Chloroherpetonaceae bacterium]
MSKELNSFSEKRQDSVIAEWALLQAPLNYQYLKQHFIPPPHFEKATLDGYITDPNFLSQAEAVASLKKFLTEFREHAKRKRQSEKYFGWLSRKPSPASLQGLYLDGIFGVGKTHLLASLFHAAEGKKAYLSFTELVYLVGLQGLEALVEEFAQYDLICIDEFELDDPGNTTMSLGFLERVIARGGIFAATSNTPPYRLGEGRFDARNFQREIKEMASRFKVIPIDGLDFRLHKFRKQGVDQMEYRSNPLELGSRWNCEDIESCFNSFKPLNSKHAIILSLSALLDHLRRFHPMHCIQLAEAHAGIFIKEMDQISHQYDALRFVYFIDKCYDHEVSIFTSGNLPLPSLFPEEFYQSAYAKKYLRCVSRLSEICNSF